MKLRGQEEKCSESGVTTTREVTARRHWNHEGNSKQMLDLSLRKQLGLDALWGLEVQPRELDTPW